MSDKPNYSLPSRAYKGNAQFLAQRQEKRKWPNQQTPPIRALQRKMRGFKREKKLLRLEGYSMPNSNVFPHSLRMVMLTRRLLRLYTSDHWVKPVESWLFSGPCATESRTAIA